ncbi:right-handed parallel beta-helix repeat-containing protein [Actinomadura sp. ATCC 31491]|uniref:Right-handed parallel beta-helix repeat-containing protein n=1 Tax=Actinomadura luzonensis TaxID=2805427 RepID=A0ABT0FS77_9ACTN|nr:right-handed parallel beta-helix repeat-containing protein [Actinomadura luzonensis]MCK2215180.1 right-handed parallel beta-helix repeat-containing protein [Actinomadura luzonensis]
MFHVQVAPWGDDSADGSPAHPFATLGRALAAARQAPGPAVVSLRGGTHVLTEPLRLTEADSGLVLQAHAYGTAGQEAPMISGGRTITGWRVAGGVWTADVGDLDTRQLYVDGRRAARASIDALPGAARATDTGYVTDARLAWQSPQDVEFVHRGVYPWSEARLKVAGVTTDDGSTMITMARPAFDRALELYNSTWAGTTQRGPGLPTRIENDPSFLREPGTWVLDRSRPGRHVLRYLPRPGEHPERTAVVAPALERLAGVEGARQVTFRGLVFADATWLGPEQGFVHYHGSGYYEGGGVATAVLGEGASVTYPTASVTIPACVAIDDADAVAVEGCRFTRLGASGLSITGGSEVAVRGCTFDTLSAGGVVVTGGRDVAIEDNLVRHIGLDHSGSPGIAVTAAHGCLIAHNEVTDVPHCGIVVGPGRGAQILRNRTADTMRVLADGGGVYLSGVQGGSFEDGAVVRGNVIEDTRTPYNFGLYLDYGAAWATVTENVVVRADNTAVLHVGPPLEHVVFRGNIWDADPLGHDSPPDGVTYEDNRTIKDASELAAATAAIRARAGRRRS